MTELTLKYHTKLKIEQNRNKQLRAHLKYLQVVIIETSSQSS